MKCQELYVSINKSFIPGSSDRRNRIKIILDFKIFVPNLL